MDDGDCRVWVSCDLHGQQEWAIFAMFGASYAANGVPKRTLIFVVADSDRAGHGHRRGTTTTCELAYATSHLLLTRPLSQAWIAMSTRNASGRGSHIALNKDQCIQPVQLGVLSGKQAV
jgi:hypothetical protein